MFRAGARVTFGRSPKSDQKVCLKPNAQPRRQPGQIQIVANGHTASHQRGTGGHRGRTPHPEQESGLPHYGTRRRRHLPPRLNTGRRRREQGSDPRKRPRRRAPPLAAGTPED